MTVPTSRHLRLALGALALAMLGGCAGDPMRTEVPGAINTGTFPNLNIPKQVAAEQISADEKSAMLGQIGAAQSNQASAGANTTPSTDPMLLKKRAQVQEEETLKQIEGR